MPGTGRHRNNDIPNIKTMKINSKSDIGQLFHFWQDLFVKDARDGIRTLGFDDPALEGSGMSWDYAFYFDNDYTAYSAKAYAQRNRVLLLTFREAYGHKNSKDDDTLYKKECGESTKDKGLYACSARALLTYSDEKHAGEAYFSDARLMYVGADPDGTPMGQQNARNVFGGVIPATKTPYILLYPIKPGQADDSIFSYATVEPSQGSMTSDDFQTYYNTSTSRHFASRKLPNRAWRT